MDQDLDVSNSENTSDLPESQSSDQHIAKLTDFCRNCGNPTALLYAPGRKPIPATDFTKEIMKCYHFDISGDSPDIHPTFICKSCSSLIRPN
jgi:hypothetical protein